MAPPTNPYAAAWVAGAGLPPHDDDEELGEHVEAVHQRAAWLMAEAPPDSLMAIVGFDPEEPGLEAYELPAPPPEYRVPAKVAGTPLPVSIRRGGYHQSTKDQPGWWVYQHRSEQALMPDGTWVVKYGAGFPTAEAAYEALLATPWATQMRRKGETEEYVQRLMDAYHHVRTYGAGTVDLESFAARYREQTPFVPGGRRGA